MGVGRKDAWGGWGGFGGQGAWDGRGGWGARGGWERYVGWVWRWMFSGTRVEERPSSGFHIGVVDVKFQQNFDVNIKI